jgi:hypothetical protein
MIMGLQGLGWLLVIIVLFFAGELVWKERRAHQRDRCHAGAELGTAAGQVHRLLAVIICFGPPVRRREACNWSRATLEPLLYLRSLALDSVIYIPDGGLALVRRVLTNNKFVGYALLIVVMIGQGVLGMLDYTQNLYTFGGWPNAPIRT